MALRPILLIVLATGALWQGFNSWQLRPVHPADGPIAPDDPRQTDVGTAQVTTLGGWRLTPQGRCDITARILGRETVIEHRANTPVIPVDAVVARQLKRLRVGQVVHLNGYLVNGVRDDGAYIATSLTRSDTGPGACEVMLVEEVDTF